jgi:hypothetical protein
MELPGDRTEWARTGARGAVKHRDLVAATGWIEMGRWKGKGSGGAESESDGELGTGGRGDECYC